jgi:hypothetical protein
VGWGGVVWGCVGWGGVGWGGVGWDGVGWGGVGTRRPKADKKCGGVGGGSPPPATKDSSFVSAGAPWVSVAILLNHSIPK